MNAVLRLLKKDLLLEWRQRYAINGIFLYVGSTVFVCYLSIEVKLRSVNPFAWNAIFWIVLLFAAINAVAKSFIQESKGRMLYYYTLVSPQAVIVSKIIYNAGLLIVLSTVAFCFYSLVLGNPVEDKAVFFLAVLIGSVGFSTTFTMISSIASKVDNSSTFMTILGIPLIIPMLMVLIKLSANAIDGLAVSVSYPLFTMLGALNVMSIAMAYILFPYLWRN